MKYDFRDINNSMMYDTCKVMYVTGPHPIFNNIVVDRLRESCKGEIEGFDEEDMSSFMEEFTMSKYNSTSVNNSMSFDEFMAAVKVPPVTGKWFCSADYKFLTKKQKDTLSRYYKKPIEHGVLVINISEWRDYKDLLRNRAITQNKDNHIIQLSFPSRDVLKDIVTKLFKDRGVTVAEQAVELFIMRMSRAYDEYQDTIDNICNSVGEKANISYADMVLHLKGIENYILDDFISELMKPMKSKKVVTRRKIYKMLNALMSDMGARAIVNKIKFKLDDLIEMRIQINNGNIPVMVRYNVEKIKGRIGEESRLNKLSDYSFKRYAYIASKTSLRDWYYMKLILSNIKNSWSEEESERALLSLIHRYVISTDRLMNSIGVKNTLKEGLTDLNSIFYNPYIRRVGGSIEMDGHYVNFNTGEITDNNIGGI